MSFYCVPLQARTLKILASLIKKAEKEADILEIWLDHLPINISPEEIFRLTKKPLLLVNKNKKEQGYWKGNEKERIALLKKYFQKAERKKRKVLVDVSIDTPAHLIKELNTAKKKNKLILSYHHFTATPSQKILEKKIHKSFGLGADIVKIVTYAQSEEDNLKIFQLLTKTHKKKLTLSAFCMGEKGQISRLLAPLFDSYIIYLALDAKSRTAPGQLTLSEFKKLSL